MHEAIGDNRYIFSTVFSIKIEQYQKNADLHITIYKYKKFNVSKFNIN